MKTIIDADVNTKTAETVDEMIRFFLGKLLPENIYNEITVEVEFDPNLEEIALVHVAHDDEFIRDPREFLIVSRYKKKEIDSTLAHECVHIKQMALNELRRDLIFKVDKNSKVNCDEVRVWDNEDWLPEDEYEDEDYDSPWEIEAYGREVGLTRQWKKYKRDNK